MIYDEDLPDCIGFSPFSRSKVDASFTDYCADLNNMGAAQWLTLRQELRFGAFKSLKKLCLSASNEFRS
jgi:hypothetical protein